MSTTEPNAPRAAAPGDASPATGEPATAAEPADAARAAEAAAAPNEALSPAVRRLVRQFDLDITGIHGTGPSGRIRVGDVMGMLGGRKDSGHRDAPTRPPAPDNGAESSADDAVLEPAAPEPQT